MQLVPVRTLACHQVNRSRWVSCDLGAAPDPLFALEPDSRPQRLSTRRDALAEGELPVPLKLVQINKCPILAPVSVLRPADTERLQFDLAAVWRTVRRILEQRANWQPKVQAIYSEPSGFSEQEQDAELRLYDGFIAAEERQLCDQVRHCSAEQLGTRTWAFQDERHPELFFRYRARNFPELLTAEEGIRWRQFCQQRLLSEAGQGHMTCGQFLALSEQLRLEVSVDVLPILDAWSAHVRSLIQQLDSDVTTAT